MSRIATEQMTADEYVASQRGPKGPDKSPSRVAGGRAAQRVGKSFEDRLGQANELYRLFGIADVIQLPVPTAPMPRSWLKSPQDHGGFARILAKRQRADYMGTMKGGRSIVMEAKSNNTPAASLRVVMPEVSGFGLKLHQLLGLVSAHSFGAIATLVWCNGGPVLGFSGEVLAGVLNRMQKHEPKAHLIRPEMGQPIEMFGDDKTLPQWLDIVSPAARASFSPKEDPGRPGARKVSP